MVSVKEVDEKISEEIQEKDENGKITISKEDIVEDKKIFFNKKAVFIDGGYSVLPLKDKKYEAAFVATKQISPDMIRKVTVALKKE